MVSQERGLQAEDVSSLTRNHHRPDPRTALLVVLVINLVVMSRAGMLPIISAGAIVTGALLTARLWRAAFIYTGAQLLFLFLVLVLAPMYPSGTTAFLALLGYWMFRFVTAMGIAVYAVKLITPGEFMAALRKMRVPAAVSVSATVLLRFIPVVVTEYRAVQEAIALRGLGQGWRTLLNPLKYLEFILVPLLFSCARIADEMTAAGMVRGLGSTVRPSTINQMRFKWSDAAWLVTLTALLILWQVLGDATIGIGSLK